MNLVNGEEGRRRTVMGLERKEGVSGERGRQVKGLLRRVEGRGGL